MQQAHHHGHHHGHAADSQARLTQALVLTLAFAGVEALGGWWSGSLALLGDAGHMVTDATALGLAAVAAWIAKKPPSARHTFGLGRADVIAALLNGLFMLLIVTAIVVTAVDRLRSPQPVTAGIVMLIAALGLLVNVLVALRLSHGEKTLNTRAALLHVFGDLLGSVATLIAGAVIWFTGWTPIDPILSLLICALILFGSVRLLRDALHVIMEGAPAEIDTREVGGAMAGVRGVLSVHDLHVWTLSSGRTGLSSHVVVPHFNDWDATLGTLRELLHRRFDIDHVTLQPELDAAVSETPHAAAPGEYCHPCADTPEYLGQDGKSRSAW